MSMLKKLAGRAGKAMVAAAAGYAIKRLIARILHGPAGTEPPRTGRGARNARRASRRAAVAGAH